MTHTNWRYRGKRNAKQRKEFSEAQSGRVERRWAKARQASVDEPVREDRVTEIVIRDSRRPMTRIVLRWMDNGDREGRARVTQDERELSLRPMGRTGIGRMLAGFV
jgi:hypothetical protein